MRVLFLLGWALLIGALLAAAGEIVARASHGAQGLFYTSEELWLALAPDSYGRAAGWIGRNLSPAIWPAVAATVLKLPAWLLLGLPGGLIAWLARPNPEEGDDFDPDAPFLIDELARRAREEGFGDGDDRLPEDHGATIVQSARAAGSDPILPPPDRDAANDASAAPSEEKDRPLPPPASS